MFLKKIVLKNFKSFQGKKELEFPVRVTAIVGPNGCGKSNILDAIRWILGEQSLKLLRVEKNTDLIFSGKNKGSSAGFAQGELIFDNSKKLFPLENTEISISRRIDRDGNNLYYLNHQPVRLKEIIEITAAAKIGLKGFTFINQGAVENVLKVSPEERRMMLEENLGLKSLEIKKEEAQRKLINSQENLAQVELLMQELLPHLNFLKRQVSRWEKREKLEKELESLNKQYFYLLYQEIQKEKPKTNLNFEEAKKEIEKIQNIIREKEKEIGLIKDKKEEDLENKIQNLTQEIFQLKDKRSSLIEKISLEKAKIQEAGKPRIDYESHLLSVKKSLEEIFSLADLNLMKEKIFQLIKSIDQIFTSPKTKENVNPDLEKEIQKIDQELKEKTDLLNQWQEILKKRNLNFRQVFEEINQLQQKKSDLEKEIQKGEIFNERYNLLLADFSKKLKENNLTLGDLETFKPEESLIFSLEQIERKIFNLKKALSEIGTVDETLLKEYEETNQRYNFYLQQTKDLKQAIENLNNLIKELEQEVKKNFEQSLREIDKEFNRYFRLMFKGGTAKLVEVKNEENNYWGVDIKIDLPKTYLKNLAILSGGEKTLVAISLLLAIVNYSNPPLLILDEIDAALDEENSRRFAEILKELSQETQFIVITHNRLTMEAAGVIYGVTLNDDKSSQLLSISLEEAVETIN